MRAIIPFVSKHVLCIKGNYINQAHIDQTCPCTLQSLFYVIVDYPTPYQLFFITFYGTIKSLAYLFQPRVLHALKSFQFLGFAKERHRPNHLLNENQSLEHAPISFNKTCFLYVDQYRSFPSLLAIIDNSLFHQPFIRPLIKILRRYGLL